MMWYDLVGWYCFIPFAYLSDVLCKSSAIFDINKSIVDC